MSRMSPGLFFGHGNEAALVAAVAGIGLGGVCRVRAAIGLPLWPLAAWYPRLKSRRRDRWLGYL